MSDDKKLVITNFPNLQYIGLGFSGACNDQGQLADILILFVNDTPLGISRGTAARTAASLRSLAESLESKAQEMQYDEK